MAVVTPLNNFLGPEGDTVTVDEQLLNTEYKRGMGNGVWDVRLGGALRAGTTGAGGCA